MYPAKRKTNMDPRLDTPDSVSFYHTWVSFDGIDKNNNGVRDDVEIEIVNFTDDIYLIIVYFEIARSISKRLKTSREDSNLSILKQIEYVDQLETCTVFLKRAIKFESKKNLWLPDIIKNTILREYIYHFNSIEAGKGIPSGGYSFSKSSVEDSCRDFFEDQKVFQAYLEQYSKNYKN